MARQFTWLTAFQRPILISNMEQALTESVSLFHSRCPCHLSLQRTTPQSRSTLFFVSVDLFSRIPHTSFYLIISVTSTCLNHGVSWWLCIAHTHTNQLLMYGSSSSHVELCIVDMGQLPELPPTIVMILAGYPASLGPLPLSFSLPIRHSLRLGPTRLRPEYLQCNNRTG